MRYAVSAAIAAAVLSVASSASAQGVKPAEPSTAEKQGPRRQMKADISRFYDEATGR